MDLRNVFPTCQGKGSKVLQSFVQICFVIILVRERTFKKKKDYAFVEDPANAAIRHAEEKGAPTL